MSDGLLIAIIGAALAAILPGIGSAISVQMGGKAASGVLSEKPELFVRLLILQALPGTQGIYGFLTAVILINRLGLFGGTAVALTKESGWLLFGACMPIAIVGLLSALYQGRTAVSAIHLTAKQPRSSTSGMIMTAVVETYAILALLASLLMIWNIPL